MKNRTLRTVPTLDGSFTLLYEELNEHYHSLDGAQGESEHVYIKNGLERLNPKLTEINVFEIGFGTGMNAILAYRWAKENARSINYYCLEPFPVNREIIEYLKNETPLFKDFSVLFEKIHGEEGKTGFRYDEHFRFKLYEHTIETFQARDLGSTFHSVFYDAFAPSKQDEIWSVDNLRKCFELLKGGGFLSTYCASGQFKRNLIASGFELIKEKGFAKKREMFIGMKRLD